MDVAGGPGVLLSAIVKKHTHLRNHATVFERPAVVQSVNLAAAQEQGINFASGEAQLALSGRSNARNCTLPLATSELLSHHKSFSPGRVQRKAMDSTQHDFFECLLRVGWLEATHP